MRTEHHSVHTITRRTRSLDLEFTASHVKSWVSISTSPQIVDGKLKGSTPVSLTGTKDGANHRFRRTFAKLTPGTTYYVYATVAGSRPTKRVTETSTKSQQIEVAVEEIKTISRGPDKGLRGKGDLLFEVRDDLPDEERPLGQPLRRDQDRLGRHRESQGI